MLRLQAVGYALLGVCLAGRALFHGVAAYLWGRHPEPGDAFLRPTPELENLMALEDIYETLTGKRAFLYCLSGVRATWYIFEGGASTPSIDEAEDYLRELIYAISHDETVTTPNFAYRPN
jgi:hypothetical protein